jgi:quercetin dioxygenase-like cupin family protein
LKILPSTPSVKAPAQWFTGDVWFDTIARGEEPSHVRVTAVHFSPSARTAWHSHALGQTLFVTEGEGRIQSRGDDLHKIRAGDIIHTPPDEEHWHGAAADRFMSHLAMLESLPGGQDPTTWLEPFPDDAYERANRQ